MSLSLPSIVLAVLVPGFLIATGVLLTPLGGTFAGQVAIVALFWGWLALLHRWRSHDPRWRRADPDAWLYLFPALVILGVFHILPVFYALKLSFYRSLSVFTDQYVGLQNFKDLATDPLFWMSLENTAWFAVCTVPASILLSLGIAMLLDTPIRGAGFYRTIYFLPVVTSVAAVSIVWKWVYNPGQGLLNHFLVHGLGMTEFDRYDWLKQDAGVFRLAADRLADLSPNLSWAGSWVPDGPSVGMLCVVVMSIWKGLGYNVVIFLAGLQNIPRELYEVARIDGAGPWGCFRHITWPLLSPTTYFILIITTISSFQVFAQIFMLYDQMPTDSTNVIVFYMYEAGIKQNRFGYGSAIAYALFLIIFAMTLFQKQVVEKRVHYQ